MKDDVVKNIDTLVFGDMKNDYINLLEQIIEIEKECFSDPWSLDSFIYEHENPYSYNLIFTEDFLGNHKVVGYIYTHFILDEVYINNFAVIQKCRKKGIGGILLKEIIKKAREENYIHITLEARESNENAINFYKNNGFVNIGIRRNLYSNPTENGVIMKLTL